MKLIRKRNRLIPILPNIGILVFFILYIYAADIYPGGSNLNPNSKGFSLINNYWCDLLSETAKNGKKNNSQFIALIAMFILCTSLLPFWHKLPSILSNRFKKSIRYSGITSMLIGLLLFTKHHDTVINISGLLISITITLTLIEFYMQRNFMMLVSGIFCLLLCTLNYVIYQTGLLLVSLPIMQKIAFLTCLIWIFVINIYILKKEN